MTSRETSSPWLAWPRGSDPSALRRTLHTAHESFLATGQPRAAVRDVVLESWRRSVRSGVDPDETGTEPRDVEAYREQHPLATVMPVVRDLLVSDAVESDLLVAVADGAGRLLWVEGEPKLRAKAAEMSFAEGSVWSEERVGTNAPGTALAIDHPVQIFSAEHFSHPVQAWSCSAAPVHDPETGRILGVLDVTGGNHVAGPQALTLVRAAAAAAEAQLRLNRLEAGRPAERPARTEPASLRVLGEAGGGRLQIDGVEQRLSLRHTEILLTLALHPSGLSAEQLAVALSDGEPALVTIRAELSRLRRLLGPGVLASRPYRLVTPLNTDLDQLGKLLDRGAHRQALAAYRGPVLPRSDAPYVVALREENRLRLRRALLRHATVDVLLRYAETPEAEDDAEVWAACLLGLPPGSPRRARVHAHLERLHRRLALPTADRPQVGAATSLQRYEA